MLWSTDTCQNKVSVDQYHVTISRAQVESASRSSVFLKLTTDQVLGFRLDRGLMYGWLVENRAGLFGKPVNAHPGSNVNQIITFPSMQMFLLLFCVYCDYWNSKQKAKQYIESLGAKLQNSNQNSTFSWVSLIGLWTTRFRSYAFRLAQIYILGNEMKIWKQSTCFTNTSALLWCPPSLLCNYTILKYNFPYDVNKLDIVLSAFFTVLSINTTFVTFIWNNSYLYCGCRWKRRVIIAVNFPI